VAPRPKRIWNQAKILIATKDEPTPAALTAFDMAFYSALLARVRRTKSLTDRVEAAFEVADRTGTTVQFTRRVHLSRSFGWTRCSYDAGRTNTSPMCRGWRISAASSCSQHYSFPCNWAACHQGRSLHLRGERAGVERRRGGCRRPRCIRIVGIRRSATAPHSAKTIALRSSAA